MLDALLVACLSLIDAPQEAPAPHDSIDVVTVDDAGHSVGNICVKLDITFDPAFMRDEKNKALRAELRPIATITDESGRARIASLVIDAWRTAASALPDADVRKTKGVVIKRKAPTFDPPQAMVGVVAPFTSGVSTKLDASSRAPVMIHVGSVESVELRVRDAARRSLAADADLTLRFDDGGVDQFFPANTFARRGDRWVVPIPAAKLATAHVRAGLGSDRSARIALLRATDDASVFCLDLAPAPRITGILRSPAGDPVASTRVLAAPMHPQLPRTCMLHDDNAFAKSSAFGTGSLAWTTHWDRPILSWGNHVAAASIVESSTKDDGSFSVALPFDPNSAASPGMRLDHTVPSVLRLEVHYEQGQCWLADVPFDASQESDTIDVGVVTLEPDVRMVCGSVIDDRGEPVEDAAIELEQNGGDRNRLTSATYSAVTNTDAAGQFRVRLSEARPLTARKDGYVAPTPRTIEPGSVDNTFQLERCAALTVACKPSATLVPEHFTLAWRRPDLDGSARLHKWQSAIDRLAPGQVTISLLLDGIASPIVERTLDLAPGATKTFDADLRDCGLVTLHVTGDDGALPFDARVELSGTNRAIRLDAHGIARFAIATPTVALMIQAPGFADASGMFAHGEHTVVLTPSK